MPKIGPTPNKDHLVRDMSARDSSILKLVKDINGNANRRNVDQRI